MYLLNFAILRKWASQLLSACTIELAKEEDYPRLYGKLRTRSKTLSDRFDVDFLLFRLHLVVEEKREDVEWIIEREDWGVASCDYCRTRDWDKHHEHCPIDTPEDSPERKANVKGDADGRRGDAAAEPDNPAYMLGYGWGANCHKWWKMHPDGY